MKKCLIISLFCIMLLVAAPTLTSRETFKPQIMYSRYNSDNTMFLDRVDIQRIFTRQDVVWDDGQAIIVYTKPLNSPEHKLFVSSTLGMTLYRYLRELSVSTRYTGHVGVHEVPNDQAMIAAIRSHDGAIGYVNYELVSHSNHVIIIDEAAGQYK